MRYSAAFPLKIMTQTRTIYDGEALAVRAPGALSPFEVLARHAPLTSSLVPGEVRVTLGASQSASRRYVAISGGVLEVRRDGVTVLADAAEWADDIDLQRAVRARDRAQTRLTSGDPEVDLDRAEAALRRAVARIDVARHVI